MAVEKYRSRIHMLLLYPEDKTHQAALKKIEQSYDYAMILHNRDYFTDEDEKKNPEHISGTLKKEHWHIVLRFNQAVWSSAICKELGIEHNYIENVKRFDNAIQYLIHYNDSDKAQYNVDEVKGNLKQRLIESINKNEKSEGEKVSDLIAYIDSQKDKIFFRDFARYCATNGYWAEFRRGASIFIKIIDEHNAYYNTK